MSEFDLTSCRLAAASGTMGQWVDRYLATAPARNAGLRAGLTLLEHYWLGPVRLPLHCLVRCCGPEVGMTYRVSAADWERRVKALAAALPAPEALPPLVLEWRAGELSVRDGNHRFAAMERSAWSSCWAVIWCNSPA